MQKALFLIPFLLSLTLQNLSNFKKYKNFFQITNTNIDSFNNNWDGVFVYLHKSEKCDLCVPAIKNISKLALKYNDPFSSRNRFGIIICENSLICPQFSSQKPPVLLYKIKKQFKLYSGNFTDESIQNFVMSKIDKEPLLVENETFWKLVGKNNKRFLVSAIFKGKYDLKNEDFLIFYDLVKMEVDDKFYYCEENVKCFELFKGGGDSEVLLIFQNRKKFLKIKDMKDFNELVSVFNSFKNPFFIDFGEEFKKKVLEEMIPTLIFITDYSDKYEEEIILFKEHSVKFKKNMQACLILKNELSNKQKTLYDKIEKIFGFDENDQFPLIIFVEPNIDTMKLNQYRLSVTSSQNLEEFLNSLFKGEIESHVKSEILTKTKFENFEILNGINFKEKTFKDSQESIIFIHNGLFSEKETKSYFKFFKKIRDIARFKILQFFIVNGVKNDIPIFVDKMPSFVVFTGANYDYPIVYDEPSNKLKKFIDILDKRKEMVIDTDGVNLEDIENIFTEL